MEPLTFVLALLFPIAVLVSNVWLRTSVQRAVSHRYDGKLEQLRSDIRRTEDTFRAELRQKELEIVALRDGAIAIRSQRLALVDKRRLEAIEKLWAATKELAALKWISSMVAILKFDEAVKVANRDPEARALFKQMGGPLPETGKPVGAAESEEPFVSPRAWTLFSAYKAILTFAVARWKLLEVGLGDEKLMNVKQLRKMLTETLPHHSAWIESADIGAMHYLLEELEANLLAELRRMLAGNEDDEEAVRRVAAISQMAVATVSPEQVQAASQLPDSLIQRSEAPIAVEETKQTRTKSSKKPGRGNMPA